MSMPPLVFEPYLRPMVWGGRGLGETFAKTLPDAGPYGESWEVSAHPLHVSRVAEGPLAGALLTDLTATRADDLFGTAANTVDVFPLLVKLLDCHQLLSIQVHPNDEQAVRLTGGRERLGKTEAWVIMDVGPAGKVYAGLKAGVTRADVEAGLASGTLESCLHALTPVPGDCIFLPAGTVHAVGGGVVMAEVQQSSDATFRLYDWDRPGPDGKPRALHVRESLESIDWSAGPVFPAVGTPIPGLPAGVTGERLVQCACFNMDRFRASSPFDLPDAGVLSVWLVLDGSAELVSSDASYRRPFRRGETVLIPAAAGPLAWRPNDDGRPVTLIAASLP